MNESDGKIVLEINNTIPVELLDLTQSLIAFGREYQYYADVNLDGPYRHDTKLFIKEIRTGSIITELVPFAPGLLPILSEANTVIGFVRHLKSAIDWLLDKTQRVDLTKSSLSNISSIIEPVAKDSASQFNIHTEIHNHAPVQISITSIDANAIQNRIRAEIEHLSAPVVGLHEKVLMYWFQARNDPSSKVGDRAIIESILQKPVKVIFASEAKKAEMLRLDENLFKHAFVVDVIVETIGNRPALYKIMNVYDDVPFD
jgi:hypothetical protein